MTTNLRSRYIIIAIVLGLAVTALLKGWPPSLGIDLRGGTILTYEVERLGDSANSEAVGTDETIRDQELEDTVRVISERINSEGVKDIQVRIEGTKYLRIELPNMSKAQADQVKRRMTQVGRLQMLIMAQNGDKGRADEQGVVKTFAANFDTDRKRMLEDHFEDRNKPLFDPGPSFRWFPSKPEIGKNETKDSYDARLADYRSDLETKPWEVSGNWYYFDPEFWGDEDEGLRGFTGNDITDPVRSTDQRGGRAVSFNVREYAQIDFGAYTQKHLKRQLALVLNGEMWSAPSINDVLTTNVQISSGSGGFTQEEEEWLINCLQAGSLKLTPKLLSTEEIGASLGQTSIRRGSMAFIIGAALVLVFMLVYYRTSGMIACVALACNFVAIMAVLIILDASLTLPGMAGLILTIGMAVDANILIFERIREELAKGKTLGHAAKNGFDRAFVTIFDANLTTFIVAAFLVAYGKGPIKGFGYTLMTGIVCTMFSALYVTRTLMGSMIKSGKIETLSMMGVLTKGNITFSRLAKKTAMGSIALIIVAVALTVSTGDEKYGLDFNGGTSVRVSFNEAQKREAVLAAIATITVDGKAKYKHPEATLLSPIDGASSVVDIRLDYVPAESEDVQEGTDGESEFAQIERELETALKGKLVSETLTDINYDSATNLWSATLNLSDAYEDSAKIVELAGLAGIRGATAVAKGSSYTVTGAITEDLSNDVEPKFLAALANVDAIKVSNPFPKVRFLGPNVVADLKGSAIKSMLVSLVFILGYIWFRFKEFKYGIAATVALVHDVLIAWGLVIAFNMSGLVNVPITLNVVAAFLTIIGYSLNDTIVVFDRIRENLGNVKGSFREVVDRSINQTLSRTILTSVTTFLVVAVVLLANLGIESPLEGLAFTLLVGVVVGTYSSIFVASPVLVFLHNRSIEKAESAGQKKRKKPAVANA